MAALTMAVDEASQGGWDARERLVNAVSEVDAVGNESLARAALALVARSLKVLIDLDRHVRQVSWRSPHYSPVLARLAARLASGQAGPIAVAVADMHGDGRIREQAVAAIRDRPTVELLPFLVLRTAD